MPAGTIPVSSIPGWPSPPAGLARTAESQGIHWVIAPDGLHVSDVAAAQTLMSAYVGGALELAWHKQQKQAALDEAFDKNFDLAKFIRAGTATNVTGNSVGAFLANITNNYRSKRAAISAAPDVAAVNAVNINTGWPSNP